MEPTRWSLEPDLGGIVWNVADADNSANILPHSDHVEMSGRRVSVIVRYRVDEQRRLFVERDIFFPQLRVRENDVRGYLRRVYDDKKFLPRFTINGKEWLPETTPVVRVSFKGVLRFLFTPIAGGIQVDRTIFACTDRRAIGELWGFLNRSGSDAVIGLPYNNHVQTPLHASTVQVVGSEKPITIATIWDEEATSFGAKYTLDVDMAEVFSTFTEVFDGEITPDKYCDGVSERINRLWFRGITDAKEPHIAFTCPDPELNQLFAFCKLRAAESLFETDLMGLVHSPGGGNFYGGIWANDQCEYANPLFAFLNDADANEAAVNAYRHYAKHMGADFAPVPSSFEMGGHMPFYRCGDRGDAAMIASGMSRYLLVRGDRDLAAELYPALTWCNEYNRRKTDPLRGVVLSDTDELEGRFPTGDANLSTSVLAYDGYRMGASVARELGHTSDAADWDARANALASGIESYFGATVEGYETYRYHDGNDVLRSWICLPLVFGLAQGTRKTGTLDALFSPRLWTDDGLATQAGDTTFWDRSTLYGLRGAFIAGATEPAYAHLLSYSRRRLLGDHVPYPVEAYPENAQEHLSAESALYCRVFLEGLLGIVPTGFASFTLTPRMPEAWNEYRVQFTAFGGREITIELTRKNGRVFVRVQSPNAVAYNATTENGESHFIQF